MPYNKTIHSENKRINEYLRDQNLIDWNKELDLLQTSLYEFKTIKNDESGEFFFEAFPLVADAKDQVEVLKKKIYNYTKQYYPDLF